VVLIKLNRERKTNIDKRRQLNKENNQSTKEATTKLYVLFLFLPKEKRMGKNC
jgi:hypothetical protein